MHLPALLLLALFAPQHAPKPKLVLPPPPEQKAPQPAAKVADDLEQFHRDVMPLRGSLGSSAAADEIALRKLAESYRDVNRLAVQLARQASPDVLLGLAKVLARYGDQQDGKELQFLVLTRPMGAATKDVMEAMAKLLQSGAKQALIECLTGAYAGVRNAAAELLRKRLEASDLPQLLELARDRSEDVRQKAVDLLGVLALPDARACLVGALADRSPVIAAQAALALVEQGLAVKEELASIVSHAAQGRSFGYAAFALTMIEDRSGENLLTPDMVPFLRAELTGADPFLRATCAMALANLVARSPSNGEAALLDRGIVDGLLLVVAPSGYVASYAMLHDPAAAKLVRFTGKDLRGGAQDWRSWWAQAKDSFAGMRLRLDVTPESGASAVLTFSDGTQTLRLRGERVPPPPPQKGTQELMLSGAEMAGLVARLEELGFMRQASLKAAAATQNLPSARSLDLALGAAHAKLTGPAGAPWLDPLEAEIRTVAARERWQLYADPATESDFVKFWQQERRWLDEHGDRRERQRRLEQRILRALPSLQGSARTTALDHLLAVGKLEDLLTEQDGLALLAMVDPAGDQSLNVRLIELAILAPGDRVEHRLFEQLDALREKTFQDRPGYDIVPRVFSLLGPDRVLHAIASGPAGLRIAAMQEAASLKDMRAVPLLLDVLKDQDERMQENAVFSLGKLGAPEARQALLAMLPTMAEKPALRRAAWVALARIGGEGVLQVLVDAAAHPDLGDRLAAIQALGKLDHPQAAPILAQVFAAHGIDPVGKLAMGSLREQGALRARPALQPFLTVPDQTIRREIVLLLAEFQDPVVVPDLIAMLSGSQDEKHIAFLLSAITGVDLLAQNDRVGAIRQWFQANRDQPQSIWYLEGLRRGGVKTTLTAEQLGPRSGVGAVPELTRIMESTERPHLLVMTAAMLRETTERDFGTVSLETPPARLHAIAERYRYFAEAEKAAGK